ncbi:glycosyltransferase, partial [Candidatus Parcubacteria bacterium]
MSDLRFTVVTPVLNGEKYLAETIESVIGQSYPHWRYFIMDGGSTDKSLEIAYRYAESDERITVVSGKDKGMYDAVFKGFEMDDGEICCWINADDKFFP